MDPLLKQQSSQELIKGKPVRSEGRHSRLQKAQVVSDPNLYTNGYGGEYVVTLLAQPASRRTQRYQHAYSKGYPRDKHQGQEQIFSNPGPNQPAEPVLDGCWRNYLRDLCA